MHKQAFTEPTTVTEIADFVGDKPLAYLPVPNNTSDVAWHDPARGTHGSCYVATIGERTLSDTTTAPHRDTLWWFDGTDKWHSCGLRISSRGLWLGTRVTAPALGVVIDPVPSERTRLYVGTSVGVVKGDFSE